MSLVEHAKREMKLAGLDRPGSVYDGLIYEAVLALVEVHAKQGHSGMSHKLTMSIFNQVANFRPLTPVTSDPNEWMEVGKDPRGICYQNIRHSTCFSYDGGKTWYDIDDNKKRNWPNRKWYQRLVFDRLGGFKLWNF